MPGCAATLNGARALGMTGQLGELTENALADLIALPCRGEPGDLFEAIVQHQDPVTASMISGTWALPPQTT